MTPVRKAGAPAHEVPASLSGSRGMYGLLLLGALVAWAGHLVAAEQFPNRPVRLIIPWS